jgi:predicted DNA-binding transcriptional regulator AlpA
MNKTEIEPLLVAKSVAEMIAMPLATLKKNVSANPGSVPPSLKLGEKPNSPRRWRKSDVEAWIQNQFEASNPTNSTTKYL